MQLVAGWIIQIQWLFSVGATIGRPLHYQNFMLITNDFSCRKQILNLWFNHNSGGRPKVAPTEIIHRIGVK
ncbi:MAG TPA: hypothetical protein DCS38_01365 [Ruminococcus sp.]|nr:hypothetical protein [Ruminococcus sp.]